MNQLPDNSKSKPKGNEGIEEWHNSREFVYWSQMDTIEIDPEDT